MKAGDYATIRVKGTFFKKHYDFEVHISLSFPASIVDAIHNHLFHHVTETVKDAEKALPVIPAACLHQGELVNYFKNLHIPDKYKLDLSDRLCPEDYQKTKATTGAMVEY